MRAFQEKYEFLVCAVNQVPPFDATLSLAEVDRRRGDGELRRLDEVGYWISATCCPAISVPAGFTPEGLPVGMQIVGRYRDDLGVLQMALRVRAGDRGWRQRRPSAERFSRT